MSAKIVCGALAVVVAAWSGRARADDCTEVDKDTAAWAAKVVVHGSMVEIDCDTCAVGPTRVKKVEVRKGVDPSLRSLAVDGRVVDLSTVYVQTGPQTFTSVGAMVGCTSPSEAMARNVAHRDQSALSSGVPDCDRYAAAVGRYLQCNKIPESAKDGVRQGLDAMKQGWQMLRDPNVPPEARKAAGDACKEATDAVKQAASAMGCPF
jgi:hypothetical protein